MDMRRDSTVKRQTHKGIRMLKNYISENLA